MRLLVASLVVLALAAGCTEPEPSEGGDGQVTPPGHGFAPQQGHGAGTNHGIDVDVTWRACEDGFCANATATNNGSSTVYVSSICVSPWSERMTHEGKAAFPHEDQAVCLAYGRAAFAPGATQQADFTWDGRLWADGKAKAAPEGAYTWTIVFTYDLDQEGTAAETTADLHLIVGET